MGVVFEGIRVARAVDALVRGGRRRGAAGEGCRRHERKVGDGNGSERKPKLGTVAVEFGG